MLFQMLADLFGMIGDAFYASAPLEHTIVTMVQVLS